MTVVDVIVVGIILLAGLFSWVTGFIRLVSGVGGWVGAGVATLYAFPHVRPVARGWIADSLIADAVAGLAVFIGALLVLSFVSHHISRRIHESGFRPIDRSMGLLTGLICGILFVAAVYLVVDQATEGEDRPQWLNEARTEPIVRRTAYFLWSFAPSAWQKASPGFERAGGEDGEPRDPAADLQNIISPPPKGDAPDEKKGYTGKERDEMDRLIRGRK